MLLGSPGASDLTCHNEIMHHPASHLLTDLSVLVDSLGWLRSVARRQASQPWQPIKCGPSREPVSVHLARFQKEWTAALRSISRQCPAAADECARLLMLDPIDARNDAITSATIARIRHLSDPHTIRSMQRERERHSFGANLRHLRLERGLSLRKLASECAAAAQLLRFRTHTPEHYQIVAYEAGRLGAHPRTVRVIAAALGVAVDQIYG
jgi:hypothetical protein